MTRTARVLALAALLSAPAAQGFIFAGGPCGPMNCNPQAAAAAMKAVSKFQPKVNEDSSSVTFKFESDAQEDIEVAMSKMGAASMLNVNFKNAAMPFFQGMQTKAGLSRSFFMPPSISADDMTTSWEAGILTVTLPKKVQDEVKQQRARSSEQQKQQPQQQQQSASSSADYLKSLSTLQRPKATGERRYSESKQQQQTTSAAEPATAGQYIDQLLSEMFGVPAGTDPFAPPSEEWIAAQKERAEQARQAHLERRAAIRRANMHTTWSQTDTEYSISIEIPQGTSSKECTLLAAEGQTLEVKLASGAVKRIQLPRDAKKSAVKASFVRDGKDKSVDLVARCVVVVPKEQPQTINIEMA